MRNTALPFANRLFCFFSCLCSAKKHVVDRLNTKKRSPDMHLDLLLLSGRQRRLHRRFELASYRQNGSLRSDSLESLLEVATRQPKPIEMPRELASRFRPIRRTAESIPIKSGPTVARTRTKWHLKCQKPPGESSPLLHLKWLGARDDSKIANSASLPPKTNLNSKDFV